MTKSNKIFFSLIVLFLISYCGFAQKRDNSNAPFAKGTKIISVGAGVGVFFNYTNNYPGSYVHLPSVFVMYDQGIVNNLGPGTLGVGGIVGFKSSVYNYNIGSANYKSSYTNYIVALRASYHLTLLKDKNPKFDPYAGIMLGVRFFSYTDNSLAAIGLYNYQPVYSVKGVFIGARYNLTKNFGVFAEAGFDISLLRGGISLKL